MAIIPPPLKSGSRLAAVSPAGPIELEEIERGRDALVKEGFDVIIIPDVLTRDGYLAGNDKIRADNLKAAFLDKNTDGVICTRGGYGSMRLLELLDSTEIAANHKPFIGFSDITALQWALWRRERLVTFSGPQLARGWGDNLSEFSRKTWVGMLRGELWGKVLPLPKGQEKLGAIRAGAAQGRLLGGNLAVLSALCGTMDSPQFNGAILILEEIDEPLYRIDRMLTQLRLCGAFNGIKGCVVGRFILHQHGEQINQETDVINMLSDMLADEVPIVCNAPFGHVDDCWTLPIGSWATLDADAGSLTVEPLE